MRRMRELTAGVALLMLPVFMLPIEDMPVRLGKEACALWIGCALLTFSISCWWVRAFAALCLAHLVWNPAQQSFWQMMLIGTFAGLFTVISQMDDIRIGRILAAVRAIAVVQAAIVIAQWPGTWDTMGFWYPRGLSGRANDAGAFLALCLPAFYCWRRRLPAVIGAAFTAVGIIAARTSVPVIAAGAGAVCWLYFSSLGSQRKRGIVLAMVAVSAGFLIMIDDVRYTIRQHPAWIAWRQTILHTKPEGHGLASFRDKFPAMTKGVPELSEPVRNADGVIIGTEKWQQAQNEYLQMTFELGWSFALIATGYLAAFAAAAHRIKPAGAHLAAASGVVTLAVGCAGFFWMHLADAAAAGVLWMALWSKKNKRRPNREKIFS